MFMIFLDQTQGDLMEKDKEPEPVQDEQEEQIEEQPEERADKPDEPDKSDKPVKKSRRKAVLLCLLVLLLVGAAAAGGWWWRDKAAKKTQKQQAADISSLQKTNASLKKQLAAAKAKNSKNTSEQTACALKSPSASATGNIKDSITSGNTAALGGYMAPTVNVIIAASEGLGPKTPDQ